MPTKTKKQTKSQSSKTKDDPRSDREAFRYLQERYGLKTPEQIKLRLIWNNLQALMLETFGDTLENRKVNLLAAGNFEFWKSRN